MGAEPKPEASAAAHSVTNYSAMAAVKLKHGRDKRALLEKHDGRGHGPGSGRAVPGGARWRLVGRRRRRWELVVEAAAGADAARADRAEQRRRQVRATTCANLTRSLPGLGRSHWSNS